jgi:putative ABC transport system permease protein
MTGLTIEIRGIPFEVVGVLAAKGEQGFMSPDETIFIPASTARYRVFGNDRLRSILVKTPTAAAMDPAMVEIDRIVRRLHRTRPGEDSPITVRNQTSLLETAQDTTRTFTYLLAGIAMISLLVGGIGIMNIMLVSVTERTREIGVRKALGARRRDIMLQFLVEALVLCLTGGALGIAAGFGGAAALTRIMDFQAAVAMDAVVLALGFSGAVGLFFGLWPARRAARLDPIVSLRYE